MADHIYFLNLPSEPSALDLKTATLVWKFHHALNGKRSSGCKQVEHGECHNTEFICHMSFCHELALMDREK